LGALLNRLLVEAVRLGGSDLNYDRPIHLVGDHCPQTDLALTAARAFDGCRARRAHASFSALVLALARARFGLTSSTATSGSLTGSASAAESAGSDAVTSVVSGAIEIASGATWATIPNSRSRSTVMMRAM